MHAVITGATGGVGSKLGSLFASEGWDLTLIGRDEKKLQAICESIESAYGVQVEYYHFDIMDLEKAYETIDSINGKPKEVHLLINVAGVFPYGNVMSASVEDYNTCMDVNVRFPLILSKGLFHKLRVVGGKVINIGSSSSFAGFKNTVLYCASKHALLGMSRALNDEWKDQGVTVHSICPGTIDTEMASVLDQDPETYISTREFAQLVFDVCSYSGNMVVDEVRAVRKSIK